MQSNHRIQMINNKKARSKCFGAFDVGFPLQVGKQNKESQRKTSGQKGSIQAKAQKSRREKPRHKKLRYNSQGSKS